MLRDCGRRWALLFLGSWALGCNGAGPVDGAGGEGPGVGSEVVCYKDATCDDAVFCNGPEVCEQGVCRRKAQAPCSDGVVCTVDRCDESTRSCTSAAPDEDGDGHLDALCTTKGGEPLGDDCDDKDAERFPGNPEVCDGQSRDEDCNPSTIGFRDGDNDGYVDSACCNEQPKGDPLCGEDCDDGRSNVSPAAPEECDFLDNDCNGEVDEGKAQNRYRDADHDGHGAGKAVKTCFQAVGYSDSTDDCDDADPEVFTGQFEICDGKDNNCDPERLADEIEEQAPWYPDVDKDGYGDPAGTPVWSCFRVAGRVLSQNDCTDDDKAVNPNAPETCDAKDNDCNGLADFRLPKVNDFEDDDGDGNPDAACGGTDTDCNDRDSSVSAGAEEVCDHVDNDCDGEIDEQTTQTIWYVDEDGDGWGVVVGSALASCEPIEGRSRNFGDCDDSDVAAHPGVTDFCDGQDNDCDGQVDEGADAYCHLPNALSVCQNADCAVYTCQPGFVDEDRNADNGCEAEVDPADLVLPQTCTASLNCDDGDFCNGFESCFQGQCRKGSPINCVPTTDIIFGDVFVTGVADIRALLGVRRITGSVSIQNTTLKNLVGLESLQMIGGNLSIVSNPKLERLSGSALSNLQTVGGTISVQYNDQLVSADLPGLVSARALEFGSNQSLVDLSGFSRLVSTESIRLGFGSIREISAFSALTEIGGADFAQIPDYSCEGNCPSTPCSGGGLVLGDYALADLSGFAELREVRGDLCLLPGTAKTLTFPKLVRVGSTLEMSSIFLDGSTPEDLEIVETIAFPKLEEVGALRIEFGYPYGVSKLKELSLPKLKVIGGGRKGIDGVLNAGLGAPLLSEVSLPRLQEVDVLAVQIYSGSGLTGLSFPALSSVASVSVRPQNPQYPTLPLGTIDFSALEKVGISLELDVPVTKQNQTDKGLVLTKLKVVGTPGNNGDLALCTGTFNPQTSLYEGASCDVVAGLVALGFVGVSDTCGQCGAISLGLSPSPFAGNYYVTPDGESVSIDCAGNLTHVVPNLGQCTEFATVEADGSAAFSYSNCEGTPVAGKVIRVDASTLSVDSWFGTYGLALSQATDCTGAEIWTGITDGGSCPYDVTCESSSGLPRTIRAAITSVEGGVHANSFFVGMASPMDHVTGGTLQISLPDLFGSATCGTGQSDAAGVVTGFCYESTEFGSINYNYTMKREYPPLEQAPL